MDGLRPRDYAAALAVVLATPVLLIAHGNRLGFAWPEDAGGFVALHGLLLAAAALLVECVAAVLGWLRKPRSAALLMWAAFGASALSAAAWPLSRLL